VSWYPGLSSLAAARDRWTVPEANAWYSAPPWVLGSNYIPANAINQLEMWQRRHSIHSGSMSNWAGRKTRHDTMRVFCTICCAAGFARIQAAHGIFLDIAAKHGIKPVFVLLIPAGTPAAALGPQHPPIPGVSHSGWVQSPGAPELADPRATRNCGPMWKASSAPLPRSARLGLGCLERTGQPCPTDYETREAHDKFNLWPRCAASVLLSSLPAAGTAADERPLESRRLDAARDAQCRRDRASRTVRRDLLSRYNWPEKFESRVAQLADIRPPHPMHRIHGSRRRLDDRRLAGDRQAKANVA